MKAMPTLSVHGNYVRNTDFIPAHRKRNDAILRAIKKGESHTSIGKRFGLSRSRIGVILMKAKRLGLV